MSELHKLFDALTEALGTDCGWHLKRKAQPVGSPVTPWTVRLPCTDDNGNTCEPGGPTPEAALRAAILVVLNNALDAESDSEAKARRARDEAARVRRAFETT
jgi:hypothetical protein